MRELLDLARELFKENPPVYGHHGVGGEEAGASVIAARKREWVAQRVSELSEVVGCMVIAGYHRYRVRKKKTTPLELFQHLRGLCYRTNLELV